MSGENEKSKGTGDWRLKQIALVAYAVATAIGMFYGNAYYDHFGISLLDYASPIDLLFIALANLEAAVGAALIVPVLFLCLCLILLFVPLLLYVLLVLGVTLIWAVLLLCAGMVVGVQAAAVAIVRVTALRAYWLRTAFAAVWADRRKRAERFRAIADQGDVSEASEQPLPLAAAYQQASQHVPIWKTIDPQAYVHFIHDKIFATFDPVGEWANERLLALKVVHQIWASIRGAYCYSEAKEQSSARRWRFRSWQAIDLRPRLLLVALVLVFLAYLLYAASQLGEFDAQKLVSDAEEQLKDAKKRQDDAEKRPGGAEKKLDDAQNTGGDSRWWVGRWEVIQKLLFDVGGSKTSRPRGVFVVPTENLASLDFSNCFGEIDRERRLFGRANFRQDAGDDSRDGTPECLLRLGGLGRWQFLADIQNGGARKQRRTAHVHSGDPRDPVIFVVNNGQQSIPLQPEPPPQTAGTEEKVGHPFVVVFDGRTGAVSTPACELQLTAVVGPFPTGQAELESNGPASSEPRAEPPECKIRGEDWTLERVGDDEQGELPEWQDELIKGTSEMVVLVGRADVRPINNSDFISNMNLATRRTNWVREELEEEKPSLNISNITGGPADSEPNDDPCSRVVEVYTCSAEQAASKDA